MTIMLYKDASEPPGLVKTGQVAMWETNGWHVATPAEIEALKAHAVTSATRPPWWDKFASALAHVALGNLGAFGED